MARIETLKPFVEQLIFGIDVDAKRSGSRYGFHLDYETKTYREKALAGLIRDSVEYFALTHEEFEEFIKKGDLISANIINKILFSLSKLCFQILYEIRAFATYLNRVG